MNEHRVDPIQRNIIRDIIEERNKQRQIVAEPEEDLQKNPSDWVGILTIWVGKAAQETPLNRGRGFSSEMFRRRLVQVAAISLAALEALDARRGKGREASDGSVHNT